ncbi:MAG TPA: penicillin-binding transpeptidase domain-containing protein [Candidatus Limnocylindria bacterium]|nr:penicillin-binding transpeptidase domain-containing protein [Candidatus Limnocylindria bacterium]
MTHERVGGAWSEGGGPPSHARRPGISPEWAGRRIGIGAALGRVSLVLAFAFGSLALGAGYWQVIESANLSTSGDDAAVIAAARNVLRGEITDRDGERLAWNKRDDNGEPYRVYASDAVSHVIGYSSRQFGTAGLENAWNAQLSGVISADPLRELTRKFRADPSDPQSLRSTLSLQLQQAAVDALGSNRGAIVMIDPRNGEILALASTPTFDASAVANPATAARTMDRLRAAERQPLLPRATLGRYVPGSVFKIVTAIAALGSGAVGPNTTYEDQPGSEKPGWLIDGFRVRDGHHSGTGSTPLAFAEAVEASCNIWFAETGVRTGGQALADWAAKLGFGSPLAFDLQTAASQVTNGDGAAGGGFSDRVELANAAYGQGETLVTPLQMALVAATVANHGNLMRPHLVIEATGKGGSTTIAPEVLSRVVASGVADEIGAAMRLAVSGDIGRIFTAGASVRNLAVAGKSGTAELDPSTRPHSWFIGFAPYDDPQVAIAVMVENSGGGSVKASPIAGDMFRAWRTWANQ